MFKRLSVIIIMVSLQAFAGYSQAYSSGITQKDVAGKGRLTSAEENRHQYPYKTYRKFRKKRIGQIALLEVQRGIKLFEPNQPHLYLNVSLPLSIWTLNTRAGGGTDYQFFSLKGFQDFYILYQDFTLRLTLKDGPFKLDLSGSLTFPDYVGYYTWGPGGEGSEQKELQKEWSEWSEKTGYKGSYFEHYLIDVKAGCQVLNSPVLFLSTGLEWSRLDNGLIFERRRFLEKNYGLIEYTDKDEDVLAFTYHSNVFRIFNDIEIGWVDNALAGSIFNCFTLGAYFSPSQRPGYYLRFTNAPYGPSLDGPGIFAEIRWSPDEWLFRSSWIILLRLF
jgi:hypothetical protein